MNEFETLALEELKAQTKAQREEDGIYDLETIRATLYNYKKILSKIDHIAKILTTDNIKILHNSTIANIQDVKVSKTPIYKNELEKTEELKEKLQAKYFRYCLLIKRLDYAMEFLEDIEQTTIQAILIDHEDIKKIQRILAVKNIDTILKRAILKLHSYLNFC